MMRRTALQLLVFQQFTLFGAVFCQAQPTESHGTEREKVAREIRDIVEELQAVRHDAQRAEEEHQSQIGRIQRQIELLQQQLNPAETAAEADRQEIVELEKQIRDRERAIANASKWIAHVSDSVKLLAVRAGQRVRNGVNEQQLRRLAEIAGTVELLSSDDPVARVDGIREFFRVLGEEWLPARSVTLANQPVYTAGDQEMVHAWVVGFGLVAKAFVSEDGKLAGISSGEPESDWNLDLPEDAEQQVRELVGVVREQRPPAVTPLPIVISPNSD